MGAPPDQTAPVTGKGNYMKDSIQRFDRNTAYISVVRYPHIDIKYLSGYVKTRRGIVLCESNLDSEKPRPHSSLQFMWGGKTYHRRFQKNMTARALAIAAGKFVKEVVR